MKVIFLDFDGVLNSERFVRSWDQHGVPIDPSRITVLKRIVAATDAKIVLSTSWRSYWAPEAECCDAVGIGINTLFREYGLEIFDRTPDLHRSRELEIAAWLADHPQTENYVVLDDDFLDGTGFLKGHFIKTSRFKNGLEEADSDRAIEILNSTKSQ